MTLTDHPAFAVIGEDLGSSPHLFAAFRYAPPVGDDTWTRITQLCLKSWRLTAAAYIARVEETGFKGGDCIRRLNDAGVTRLPDTPPENSEVTKNRHVTDMTEILALVALDELVGPVTFPYPGVLHHDAEKAQHRGIDLIGYTQNDEEYALLISEVMATNQARAGTPSTVTQHHRQLLADTLNQDGLGRLLYSLSAVHDEASESQQQVLGAFIAAALDGSLKDEGAVIASPVLVRKNGKFTAADWKPFLNGVDGFEKAKVPATVMFLAIEACETFSGWLDEAKLELSKAAQPIGPADA